MDFPRKSIGLPELYQNYSKSHFLGIESSCHQEDQAGVLRSCNGLSWPRYQFFLKLALGLERTTPMAYALLCMNVNLNFIK